MATFFMFGRYSSESVKKISAERTRRAVALLKKYGGEIKSIYALLGECDLVLIVVFPGIEPAMKASVALTKATGISFSTSPAMAVEQFDAIMRED